MCDAKDETRRTLVVPRKQRKRDCASARWWLVLLVFPAGCSEHGRREPVRGRSDDAIACLGRIVPGDGVIEVAAPYALGSGPAIVAEVAVRPGDAVVAGQVLASLHTHLPALADAAAADAIVALRAAELERVRAGAKPGDLAARRALVALRGAELVHARLTFERTKRLRATDTAAEAELDGARQTWEVASRALEAARAEEDAAAEVRAVDVAVAERELAAAKAQREAARLRAEATLVRAPLAGVVLDVHRQPGEAGTGTLLQLADTSRMWVEAYAYESDVQAVREGATATIGGVAFAGTLSGTVARVGTVVMPNLTRPLDPDTPADRRVVKVRIALTAEDAARVMALNRHEVWVRIAR